MKAIRHTVNIPGELMNSLILERAKEFRNISAYFTAMAYSDLLWRIKNRPFAKAFANASWEDQRQAVQNVVKVHEQGRWAGLSLQLLLKATEELEPSIRASLGKDDWVLKVLEDQLIHLNARVAMVEKMIEEHRGASPRVPKQQKTPAAPADLRKTEIDR
jgi:hypothetical protein